MSTCLSRYLVILMLQAGSCYPGSGSGEDKAVSVGDLSQSTDTLLRSHKPDTVIWEDATLSSRSRGARRCPEAAAATSGCR